MQKLKHSAGGVTGIFLEDEQIAREPWGRREVRVWATRVHGRRGRKYPDDRTERTQIMRKKQSAVG